jgi:hypothetical protein
VNVISGLAGACSGFFHLVLFAFDDWENSLMDYMVVRSYGIFFGALIVLVEMENSFLIKYFGFLENWVCRGLFLVFVGALCTTLEEYRNAPVFNHHLFTTCRLTISYLLYGCGLTYIILGMLCIRSLKQRELTMIRKRKQAAIQAKHLNEQKSEIEQLLRETESRLQGTV